ncbi:MAG: hypothetical protein AAF824_17810 [Bacteroidota bacterium]
MKLKLSSLLIFLVFYGPLLYPQLADINDEKLTTAGNIGATISNLGLIGNGFSGSFNLLGFPSCEFPVNSGIEHIFDGGLWIGGVVNGQIAVSTGAIDDASGFSTGKRGFEFTSKVPLTERSSLFDSPFFSTEAVSQQDFISTFTDTAIVVNTGTSRIPIEDHLTPLGVAVDFEAYNWNFNFANFFIILNFKITNVNTVPIDSMYVGYWMDGVVRNVNLTPPGGSAFFNKGGNGFIDSLDLAYEFDAIGDIGFTDSYVASKYLGSDIDGICPGSPSFGVNYNAWQFRNTADPLYFFPTSDFQRYGKMASGLNQLPSWPTIQSQINSANNRSHLISAGPYVSLLPGESLNIAFAIVCARRIKDGLPAEANTPAQREALIQNANWAQTTYFGEDVNGNCELDPEEDLDGDGEIDRFILPSPPEPPRMKIISQSNKIDVFWSNNSAFSVDPISNELDFEGYRLYKTRLGFDIQNTQDIQQSLELIAAWDSSDNKLFFDTGFESARLAEAIQFEGDTTTYHFKYTFDNIANGWQHVIALTAFDKGDEANNLASLESAPLANLKRVFAGTPANNNFSSGDPFVYPNPYYARSNWEGRSTFEEDRRLMFANLPERAEVRIYSVSGDLIDVFEHNETYRGEDTRWFSTYSNSEEAVFSGGEHAWDLLSRDNQILSRGLYLFVVTDQESGEKYKGRFVIIK